jgi:hypothetical protein
MELFQDTTETVRTVFGGAIWNIIVLVKCSVKTVAYGVETKIKRRDSILWVHR